ncbi:hypothetical protein [Tenacibaculum maritimum]|uniref:hypothetical protein n=1 Tax=Tenacibaculum maritimum TaxID=107401 RepID=UPI003875D7DE
MNKELIKTLSTHLKAHKDNAVRVISNGQRLKKNDESVNKYAFTDADIQGRFESIDNFLITLYKKGFTDNVEFLLVKMYSDKTHNTRYRNFNKITVDLTENTMQNSPITLSNQQQTMQNSLPQNLGMGYLGAPELINKMVEAERGKDYKKTAEVLEEQLKDATSKIRILEEKNSSLEIKIATQKERSEIQRERDKLNQKGFLDSDAGNTVMETLGGMIPQVLEIFKPVAQAPNVALASPEITVSAIKKTVIEKIQSQAFSDEQTSIINYILDNWQKEFIENIVALINKREEHGN